MPLSRSCRSSYDCIVKIKGVTMRPILFSQLMRSDGEGAMNPEELFADDRSPASEQERVHEDELHSLMRSILDWAISFLSESSQGTIRAIYFEGKTVKQHSEEEYVTVYAIYKRLARSYPVTKEIEAPMYVNLLFSPEISAKHRILPGTGHSSDGRSRRSLPFGIRR